MKKNHQTPSKFQNLESHFLNVFHAGVYLSGQELVIIGQKYDYDLALKSREHILKNLLNSANNDGKLQSVLLELSQLIESKIERLKTLSNDYINTKPYLQEMIQRSQSSMLLLKQQQRNNPYE
jgi:hypothetical protein